VRKILALKVFEDPETSSPWKSGVVDIGGEVLFVSQFTLHAVLKSGAKPSFHRAMAPESARGMFGEAVEMARGDYNPDAVKACVFGSMMNVSLVNEGPVTIILDSKEKK